MEVSPWAKTADESPSDRKVLRIVATVVVAVFSIYLIYLLRTPLTWLLLAALLAIAASGPVNLLARHMKRGLAIAIVYLGILLIPFAVGAVLLPPLVSSAVDLVRELPIYINDFQDRLQDSPSFAKLDENFDFNAKLNDLSRSLSGDLGDTANTLGSIGAGIINSIFASFTIFILSMFMVARGRNWVDAWIRTRPVDQRPRLERTASRIGGAVSGYIGGAIAQAFIAGLAAFVVLSILGVPSPLVLAAMVAAFDVIPMVGSSIAGLAVGVVTVFAADLPIDTIVWAAFVIAYQQFENYVIQPQIQRRAAALEPFTVLVAVIFGGTLMGVVGAVIAIPVTATLQILYQEYRHFQSDLADGGRQESATPV
ncbi:MAG: AI-2E family transporter [Solirubrobacterales bacterium]